MTKRNLSLRLGRPRIPQEERMDVRLHVNVNQSTYEKLLARKKKTRELGLSVTARKLIELGLECVDPPKPPNKGEKEA